MIVDVERFRGKCTCGQEHNMKIQKILIEHGALEKIPQVVQELGLKGKPCLLCDTNTYEAAGRAIEAMLEGCETICLDAADLHPDEKTVSAVNSRLPADTGYLIAAGGGVLTDTGKYIGFTHGGIPVIVVPTAASVDGFAADSSVMTFRHFKHPLTTQAAAAIVADTAVLAKAPYRLTASGLGDLLGKYIALADWRFAHLVGGEPLCERIYQMVEDAVKQAVSVIGKVAEQDEDALGALMYALILSGLTIQMWGNSRPASGSEHHISHLWELNILHPDNNGLHGEMVGVGTIVCKQIYEKIFEAAGDHPENFIREYKGMDLALLKRYYGDVFDELMKYNDPDETTFVDRESMIQNWGKIREIYEKMPSSEEMLRLFESCGMKSTLASVGVDSSLLPVSIQIGPYVRGRLTLYRVYTGMMDMTVQVSR